MPFLHIVLVKVKPEVLSAEGGLDGFAKQVDTLKSIDVVKQLCTSVEHGPPVYTERAQGFNYGLYTTFKNRADYEVYRDDAGHRDFVKTVMGPNAESVLAYDWDHP
ncbi:hypothetical protein OC834_005474 [Tilletia horrida]|uniref:Stress-response A/B barrel domain-containing protein n=1 Tax=Tilletia horrida TaxID=155126 RepID=A0AAN6G7B2_9BASI|nr:hypothetical protein OC835_006817 [Tilletia horrida]KAK0524592.1 hypothetical protein OC834_005474 [Tilletia horrida]KAK0525652.1 hypothetical protein OC842_005436 [Tilletia horrida]KAK0566271.1 hypothetical protein OC844_000806 [Tilletia horrida]